MQQRLPLIAPQPPRLSRLTAALERVEASGTYSNTGPEVRAFEAEATAQLFGGCGDSLAVANATLGLILAISDQARPRAGLGLALMPALTFAATAQAAHWAGLTPLICDIDPDDWSAAAAEEECLLSLHADRIAVIVPYATFGRAIDLDRYAWLADRHGVGVVVDAAASLGTTTADGLNFGAGARFPVVFSMHATKTFATAEGGLVHCSDAGVIARLRSMANFGFDGARSAVLPGLNAKLPEVLAVMARAKLAEFPGVCAAREAVAAAYRAAISDRYGLQSRTPGTQAMQFFPVLLPPGSDREVIAERMAARGIGTGRYFSPHLGEQPWIRANAQIEPTPVADDIAARLLSLPITDRMTPADAERVAAALDDACRPRAKAVVSIAAPPVADVLIVGGGPAGSAVLTAATKRGLLPDFARNLVVVERDHGIGGGRLGHYAITSDSTAQTFLSAVEGNIHPEIAALADHPTGRAVAGYRDALGVPLVEAGPFLRATGERLAEIVRGAGGTILTGHEALATRRGHDGLWRTTLRDRESGRTQERASRSVVIATGGHQPLDRLAQQRVAGEPLIALAGDRLVQSDSILAIGGPARVEDLLAGKRAPRIAVIGGSTSALTTVVLLLKSALPLGPGAISLLHRRPLRPFYPSVEAAHAEGFRDFGPDDVCPISGFVYRLAGFRLEARELVLRLLGVDGRASEPRVAAHRIDDDHAKARALIDDADLVIAALGYRPHALPVEGTDGTPVTLAAHYGAPMVDRHCRVTDAAGQPIPGLYGIGLAAGFVPWGSLGGEASFRGQANGLWLWQNDVGLMIVDQVMADIATRAVA
ncbi:Aminotransferase DegT [Sphingomonas sp. EC-HK361]|uniref:DegT/DnrJ/EryC1/StrS family aminotransferase n=1 Tax=Sphingomonas sp. EC-HK361 TaxID=2038397 RepID=UPI0012536723|nr:DegT/DnrJ/EryC1/StrS family aminotransferase [Sphingomonas sp. EC-HK361]VVT04784.1 Aminotransferase DegT [Sphingomonas sp. EC-HK361]